MSSVAGLIDSRTTKVSSLSPAPTSRTAGVHTGHAKDSECALPSRVRVAPVVTSRADEPSTETLTPIDGVRSRLIVRSITFGGAATNGRSCGGATTTWAEVDGEVDAEGAGGGTRKIRTGVEGV